MSFSSSSSSSSSKSTSQSSRSGEGSDYSFKLSYYPNVDSKIHKDPIQCEQGDLLEEDFKTELGPEWNAPITKVYVYRHDIPIAQVNDLNPRTALALPALVVGHVLAVRFLFHAFIIFKTADWWYSAEKCEEGLFMQRSKDLASIRDNLERNPRNVFGIFGIQLVKDADGHGTVGDLIKVICDKDLLRKKYHFMTENCKQFAAEIFNSCSFGKCSVGLRPLVDLPHPCERDHEAA